MPPMSKILYQLTSPMEKTVLGADEVVRRRDFLRQRAGLGVEVAVRSLGDGPASIESAWEAALVVPALCESAVRAQAEGFSAIIVGCFSDPGLDALREDGADLLVLGCMSMGFLGITDDLQKRLDVPVVNPVTASLKTAEAVVAMGLSHSKVAYPMPRKLV